MDDVALKYNAVLDSIFNLNLFRSKLNQVYLDIKDVKGLMVILNENLLNYHMTDNFWTINQLLKMEII